MKKGKMIIGALALVVAVGTAYAFKANSLPGNLYYFNDNRECVAAPCSTENQIGERCQLVVYRDSWCEHPYRDIAYVTECAISK